tara:strand:+ start:18067 stop:18276 length:210 start_codon:yes stop_codon:yes gene_type:complete
MAYILNKEDGGILKIIETKSNNGPFQTYDGARRRAIDSMTTQRDIYKDIIEGLNCEIVKLLNVSKADDE